MSYPRKYHLSSYALTNEYLSVNLQGAFSFSSFPCGFVFVPAGTQSKEVKITVYGAVLNAQAVCLKADVSNNNNTVTLAPLHPNNKQDIIWTIVCVPNVLDSSRAYYLIKSSITSGGNSFYLCGTNTGLTLVESNDALSASTSPGAYWSILEYSIFSLQKPVIQFGQTKDASQPVVNSDGSTVNLSPLIEYLFNSWSWKMPPPPPVNGETSGMISTSNYKTGQEFYLINPPGTQQIVLGSQANATKWILAQLQGNNVIFNGSIEFLLGNLSNNEISVAPYPTSASNWLQYQHKGVKELDYSAASAAVNSSSETVMDLGTLQHLAAKTSMARSCLIFSDKNTLQILIETDTGSGFKQETVTAKSGKSFFGWALNDQNLYLINNQLVESYDLSSMGKIHDGALDATPVPVKKSMDLGDNNQYGTPVFDNNNAFIFILRDDGNLYALPEAFNSETVPTEYNNQGGSLPVEPIELFIESKQGSTFLYYLNLENQLVKFEMNYSSSVITEVQPYNTPDNLPVELLRRRYQKRTTTNANQKLENNWSQIDAFSTEDNTYVFDGTGSSAPFMMFSQKDPILQSSTIALLTLGSQGTFPAFDFASGTVSIPATDQQVLAAAFTLQDTNNSNIRSIGCPLAKYNSSLGKYEIYTLSSELSSPDTVKLRKYSVEIPSQAPSLFMLEWKMLGGNLNSIYLNEQRRKTLNVQAATNSYAQAIQTFSSQGAVFSANAFFYQDDMANNFYESVAPISIRGFRSILSQWLKFASIQQLSSE